MTSFARPVLLREGWLARRELVFPELAERISWWEEREASFRQFAPFDLEEPGPRVERNDRGLCEMWLPLVRIAREAGALLRGHFDLARLEVDPVRVFRRSARSWLDARRLFRSLPSLPSRFLRSLEDPGVAEGFLFELHDPISFGQRLGRYEEVVGAIAALRPRSVWDAGCGTGETSFSLARACGEVLGTTPSRLELLMCERRGRPHDAVRTAELRARTAGIANVRFRLGDLLGDPPGRFDVVFVGGVLGGVLFSNEEIASALKTIVRGLLPGGRVFVVDRFREDLHRRASEAVAHVAALVGLSRLADGSYRLSNG